MKLSIITINLNNKDGLKKTVDSVIYQTFRDFEWILIDGGSSDGSAEIIADLATKREANVSYWCSEPDKGIYNAMNKGIDRAYGEYCFFLNSGDRMEEKEKMVMNNLVFIRTDRPIAQIIENVDGLRYPYYDHTKGTPAIVPDDDLARFRQVLAMKSVHAQFLADPFTKFTNRQKVRVKAGEFEGMEGYILRVRRDRKLVVSLGNTAVAISGIHQSLLELV